MNPGSKPAQPVNEDGLAAADDLAGLERRIVEDIKRHVADSELRLRIMARSRV